MTDKDQLKNKVAKWIEEQGYPLEMQMAAILQNKGFRVVQSEYFLDPESGDSREIDIVAYKQEEIAGVTFRVSLLIECKRSKDKPWVLFTSGKTKLSDPARLAQRAANSFGRSYLLKVCREKEIQDISLFKLPEKPAYGITQALTTGKDVCYSSVTSVSKATMAAVEALDTEKETRFKRPSLLKSKTNTCSIMMPIVIVEGQLFETYLNAESEVIVENTDEGTLLWRNPMVGRPHTIVSVLSSNIFEGFADKASKSIDEYFELSRNNYTENIERTIEQENRPPIRVF